jgi:hypothetical protein
MRHSLTWRSSAPETISGAVGMERGPVDAAVVALEHVLDDRVGVAKEVVLQAQRVVAAARAHHRARRDVLLAQARDVPHAHRLIERRRDDEILLEVEVGAHDVVVVARQHGDADARLPVPDANRLVVAGRQNPRILVVKLHRANVVEVAEQREQAATLLVVPHFDLVVVAARHKQRLRVVKANAAHRTCRTSPVSNRP